MLFLDGVEGLVVVNMDLGVEVVIGNSGDGSSSIGGSGGLRRHDRRSKFCFYVQDSKNKGK
jgi:hypothetical protein